MSARDRLPLLAVLWLLTAAAAGLLFAWLLRPPATGETRVVYRDAGSGEPERVPAGGVQGGALDGRRADPGDGSPGGSPGPAVTVTGIAPGASEDRGPPPSILVTVLGDDGEPLGSGTVYALGAGEPGSDDSDAVFSAAVEGPDPVRLRLPLPGLYDIGIRDGRGSNLQTDVPVGPGEGNAVTLRPAPGLPVQVRIEGEWPPPGAERPEVVVNFWTEDDSLQREFPGRGERGIAGGKAVLTGSSGESEPLLPGRVYRCGVGVQEFRRFLESPDRGQRETSAMLFSHRVAASPDRETVRPGETLTVRVIPRGALALTPVAGAGLRESESAKSGGSRYVVAQVLREGREIARAGVGTMLQPPPNWVEPSVMLSLEPGTYDVRWEGNGLRGGSRTGIAVAAGETVEVGIPLEHDPALPPPPVPGAPPPEEAVEPGEPPREIHVEGAPPGESVILLGEFLEEEERSRPFDVSVELEDGVYRADAADVRPWTLVGAMAPPWLASDLQPMPSAGPVRVPLRAAGILLFVSTEVLPQEVGTFRVRRADGRPIPALGSGGREYEGVSAEWSFAEPLLLGPFPEGRILFEVRLGGLRLPDLRADVRAGRIEIVRVSR